MTESKTVQQIAAAIEAAEAERRAEQVRQAELHEAALAGSPEGVAARLLGAKPREIARVETWGSRTLVVMKVGGARIIVPPGDPDGAGNYGVTVLGPAPRGSSIPSYVPRPGEILPRPEDGPLRKLAAGRWGRRPEPGPTPEERAAQAEERERVEETRARRRLALLRDEVEALRSGPPPVGEAAVAARSAELANLERDLRRAEAACRSWDLRRDPPPPDPRSVRFYRQVVAACRALLGADTEMARRQVRAGLVPPVASLVDRPGWDSRRELVGAMRWLESRGLAEIADGDDG